MAKEEESLKMQSGDAHHKPHMLSLEVRNESISGKTLIEIKEFLGRQFVCSRIRHEGHVSIPNHETIFNVATSYLSSALKKMHPPLPYSSVRK